MKHPDRRIGGFFHRREGNLSIPTFVCDYCGKRIISGEEGLRLWDWAESLAQPFAATYILHKGNCHDVFEKAQDAYDVLTDDLVLLPLCLKNDLAISDDLERRVAEAEAML